MIRVHNKILRKINLSDVVLLITFEEKFITLKLDKYIGYILDKGINNLVTRIYNLCLMVSC